ncbi:MAG: hypothetical protein QM813_20640 [Verrucomicrobiota bacterium]
MKKLKPWLILALVFIAGLVAGVVATRIAVRHFVKVAITQPERLRDRIEQNLTRRLRLNDEQREKVHEALVQTHERLKILRQEVQPRFRSIVDNTEQEIAATLTPEQKAKFDQFREENRHFLQDAKLN